MANQNTIGPHIWEADRLLTEYLMSVWEIKGSNDEGAE